MKLTKKQRRALEIIAHELDRGRRYIYQPDIAVARKGGRATTTLHYTRQDGAVLYELTKEYGSDLCGLDEAARQLKLFLAESR